MTNLDSIFKSRDITLSTKVGLVKAMIFPVVMYGCESWTIKKAKHQRTDVFELWCWRRLLRVPWTVRRSNQSILKEISSLEGLVLKLKLQYFGYLMWRTDSLEKTLMLGKIEGRRRKAWQRMRWLGGITDSMDMTWESSGSYWCTGKPGVLQSMGSQRVRLSDWTELKDPTTNYPVSWINVRVRYHSLNIYCAPGSFWTDLGNLASLILLTSVWDGCYLYTHFPDEETEIQTSE